MRGGAPGEFGGLQRFDGRRGRIERQHFEIIGREHHHTDLAEFTRLGLLTVPAGLALATVALWVVLRI